MKATKSRLAKRLVPAFLTTILAASLVSIPTFAATDTTGHWAEGYVNKLVDAKVATTYGDGSFKPNQAITRVEFMSMVNNVFNFPGSAETSFSDVSAADLSVVQKSVAAGFINGYEDGTVKPSAPITRQEAAVSILLAADLPAGSGSLAAFTDAGSIGTWAQGAVSTMAAKGIINGYDDGTFNPTGNITRAEAATIINFLAGDVYSAAGTYEGNSTATYTNAVVNVPDVTLKDMSLTGDLYIAPGVGEGDVTLDNVTVGGTVYVQGGGTNSIHIKNGSITGNMVINNKNGDVRVETDTTSSVGEVVTISNVVLDGNYATITISGDHITVALNGTVGSVDVAGESVVLEGTGKVEVVNVGANNVKVTIKDVKITVAEAVTGTTAGDVPVEAGETVAVDDEGAVAPVTDVTDTPAVTTPPSGGGGGTPSGGGGGSSTVDIGMGTTYKALEELANSDLWLLVIEPSSTITTTLPNSLNVTLSDGTVVVASKVVVGGVTQYRAAFDNTSATLTVSKVERGAN